MNEFRCAETIEYWSDARLEEVINMSKEAIEYRGDARLEEVINISKELLDDASGFLRQWDGGAQIELKGVRYRRIDGERYPGMVRYRRII